MNNAEMEHYFALLTSLTTQMGVKHTGTPVHTKLEEACEELRKMYAEANPPKEEVAETL